MLRTYDLASGGRWFDLHESTDEERQQVEKELGFALPPRESIVEIELSSRVQRRSGGIVLNIPRFCIGADEAAPLGFVLTPTLLVTEHTRQHRVLQKIAAELDAKPVQSSVDLWLRMVERITDELADRLEMLEAEVADAARRVFQPSENETTLKPELRRVGEIGSQMARMHNSVLGVIRITSHLKQAAPDWFEASDVSRNESVYADVKSLHEFEEQLGDRIQFLLDGVLGQINIDQNEIMKVMAIASIVGIPPTVLVGVWGMNFHNMPELDWHYGYGISLALIVASAALPLLWFRRKGWL